MKSRRKRHDARFKAKIGLEALKGTKTIQEIAKENQLHPTQVSRWKQEISQRASELFERGGEPDRQEDWEQERERLHAKIGKQSMELDWLAKKL